MTHFICVVASDNLFAALTDTKGERYFVLVLSTPRRLWHIYLHAIF